MMHDSTTDHIWATRADIIEPDPSDMFTVSMTAQDLRMYAARHELLEALRDMTALAIQLGAIDLEVNEARAAIAKAKGEGA